MIIEYHRPDNLPDTLALLGRKTPLTLPLGGGTVLSHEQPRDIAVVDLQKLGLNRIEIEGQQVRLGATVTLQQLHDCPDLPATLQAAVRESVIHEAGSNLRQSATLAGVLVSCDGRSPFVTMLLALDTRITWDPGHEAQPVGDYLPLRKPEGKGQLIEEIRVQSNVTVRFEIVARTPMDRPIVCAAMAFWPSGRTRVALGGYGKAPILAMDGPEPGGAMVAAREAYRFANDPWASAAYRMDVAGKLVQRMLAKGRVTA